MSEKRYNDFMKKILMILSLPFMLAGAGLLSSCSDTGKINIVFGDKNGEDVQTLSFVDLQTKVTSKETFLLVVQYSDGCACWRSEAHPILKRFTQETKAIVYHIKYDDLRAGGSTFGIKIIEGSVSFAIFKDGKVKENLTTRDNPQLKDYSLFKEYMEDTIYLPKLFYVTLDDVENMYKSSEKSLIYFSRKSCDDCSYINHNFLTDWNKSHQKYERPIYVIDCDQPGIRLDENREYNEEQWFAFKDRHGLSNKNNSIFGYNGGYVPSFFLIQGSETSTAYLNGAVAFNDPINEIEEGKYVVSDSYFTEERLPSLKYIDDSVKHKVLKGLELSDNDIKVWSSGYKSWKHESAEKYFNPLLEKFFDYVEKQ